VIGGTIIVVGIFKSCEFSWSWFKTFISILVFICIYLWQYSGPTAVTILGTVAVIIAAFPEIIDTYKHPEENSLVVWLGFTASCIVSFFAGKSWAIEEWFYPGCCSILCFVLALCCAQKFFRPIPIAVL
jgi:hypothetical protein